MTSKPIVRVAAAIVLDAAGKEHRIPFEEIGQTKGGHARYGTLKPVIIEKQEMLGYLVLRPAKAPETSKPAGASDDEVTKALELLRAVKAGTVEVSLKDKAKKS